MRADLARREPQWLARWAEASASTNASWTTREAAGAPAFVLHDGPPYANGGIHYGTLLNKVLKDIVVRSQLLMGKAARFVPGWDCHGLPIEQQVEKQVGAKDKLSVEEFRKRCEAHALKFVDVMRTRVQAPGLRRPVGHALPHAVQGLRGDHRRQAGRVRPGRAALPGQAAGALVRDPPDRAGRGRGRIRRPHLAIDLRALPARAGAGAGGEAARQDAGGAGHLDHHPLDPGRQPGGGRQPRAGLRRPSR